MAAKIEKLSRGQADDLGSSLVDAWFERWGPTLDAHGIVYLCASGRGPGKLAIASNVTLESLPALLAEIESALRAALIQRERERERGGPEPGMPEAG